MMIITIRTAAAVSFIFFTLSNMPLRALHLERRNSERFRNTGCQEHCKLTRRIILQAQQPGENGSSKESNSSTPGYRFGDITRSFTSKLNEKASQITGKDTYEFGDLSKWADQRAKERMMSIKSQTGEYKYEFGDLSRLADNLVKEKAATYAGKENATDYEFGDVTKTLLKKVLSGEYDPQDVYLALRILVVTGCMLLPITQLLPLNTLFEMFELGLVKDVGCRLLPLVATTIDARMKEALTGSANYQLGDITKERLRQYLSRFTGKETYEFGDVTNAIVKRREIGKNVSVKVASSGSDSLVIDDPILYDELISWDQRFLEDNRNATRTT